ncbi:UDP-N-acetylmuramoyl-L-alanyl-D-glutamate--2,6-diaminopimelate ligase [Roseibium sp. AS2]|uniref:UDP-N-acetylmuramoyl-L-alanyl-D-glutamate--2, 6-diaminopimelate ligase n=1 Tax=Roseibium sp. AS2 TaxID=3135781 RepID=UPI00317E650C
MDLEYLAAGLFVPEAANGLKISGLTADSRKVRPGFLFAAFKGASVDGARFVPDAVAAGAVAVLCSGDDVDTVRASCGAKAAVIEADEPRQAFAWMAARFYGNQPDTIVAVTGTAGKTSVAHFVRQIFQSAGHPAASLGTLGVVKPGGETYGGLTTPDPVSLHRLLAELKSEGVNHVALEASSHGLDQHRLDGVRLTAAAFTNLGRDHMDYHPTMEDYLRAKLRLFSELLPSGASVVVDPGEKYADRVLAEAAKRGLPVFSVGESGKDLKLAGLKPVGAGQELTLLSARGEYKVTLPLIGRFQVANALVAAGLAISAGLDTGAVLRALENLKGAPGRLELAGETGQGGLVFVDYAHKPDALDNALAALKPFARGKLSVVVGAGGDRDSGKRALMGAAASRHADLVIVTDDNPRSENPEDIRKAVLEGAPGALDIGDRFEAIAEGVRRLRSGDILCVAGKGHETGQIVGDTVSPFSDHEAVRRAISLEGNT